MRSRRLQKRAVRHGLALAAWTFCCAVLLSACDTEAGSTNDEASPDPDCAFSTDLFADGGVGRDGIPALLVDEDGVAPEFVSAGADGTAYLQNSSRVIGLVIGGQAYAVPHNILWWHEIANLNVGAERLAVTYCPLTGSSLTFDRAVVDGAEFGVSGLLFRNNLTMFDRATGESLWPQMNRQAGCGPRTGAPLEMVPAIEMRWDGWASLYPETKVISSNTRIVRDYTRYPYGDYEQLGNERLLDPRTEIDERRPPKERVLGIPNGDGGGVAFPFGALAGEDDAAARVVEEASGGQPVVVFWDGAREAAMAYRPMLGGEALTFEVRDGEIVDAETESTWRIDGVAVAGPREGEALEPVADAYVAFWFAWAAFQPQTRLWEGG